MSTYVGQPIRRREDGRLLTGKGRFVADLKSLGMVEAAVLRSTHGHARIRYLDAARARAMEGVLSVFTAQDLDGHVEPFPPQPYTNIPPDVRETVRPSARTMRVPLLARDVVRRVGEPIAFVVAIDRYVAEDALEHIEIDYEPLSVVTDPEAALEPDSHVIHPELGDNVHAQWRVATGDVETALAQCDYTISGRFRVQREVGSPIETRAVLATFEAHHRQLTVWATTQLPHALQSHLMEMLHLAQDNVRVVAPDVGGSFGGGIYHEEVLAPFAAMQLGRPVRWVEDRSENLVNARHSRDQIHWTEVGFNRDGSIVALRDRLLLDGGCYPIQHALTLAYNSMAHMRGQYKIDNFDGEATCVFTNKTPNTPVRGAGRSEAAFVMDRLMDMVADRLNMDPADLRLRNLIPAEAMPYDMGMRYRDGERLVYDSGDYPAQLRQALDSVEYDAVRGQQEAWRRRGRRVGIGISSGVEGTGVGPYEGAIVRVDPSGQVQAFSGSSPHGQAHETTLAQVCADGLGVSLDQVTVRAGDTSLMPYGGGTAASRSAVTAGTAVYVAAQGLRQKILDVAGELLEVSPEDLEITAGRVCAKGAPSHSVGLEELARAAAPGPESLLPAGTEAGLEVRHYFAPPTVTFASSTQIAVVEVDDETGYVKLLRHVIVHECGRQLNPLVVEGQVAGAVVHGIGGAMFEEVVYDTEGQPMTTSFMDYLMPTTSELPTIEIGHQECLTTRNPLGIKGCGEGGVTSAPAAIANAIVDALKPLSIRISELPLKPENIRRCIQDAQRQVQAEELGR